MKKYALALVALVLTFLSSCGGVGKRQSAVNQLERGMTKDQVTALLGAPRNKSVQEDGSETWDFSYMDLLDRHLRVSVTFFNDRVTKYDSHRTDHDHRDNQPPVIVTTPPAIPPQGHIPPASRGRGYIDSRGYEEEARAFELFLEDVRRIPFDDERIGFICSVARRSLFTVEQASRLIAPFRWDEQRLTILEALAPRLRDGYNAFRLIDLFSYGSGKERARQILEANPPIPWDYDPRSVGQMEQQESFEDFVRAVERQTWDKDKINYIRDAAQRNSFTVQQVIRLLKLFTWDNERLPVLEAVAPRIRDGFNTYKLIEYFDFQDAKQKARRILGLTE